MDNLERLMAEVRESELDAVLLRSLPNRFWATGFRSSAGCVIVTGWEAFFFTDSRYIEAARAAVRGATVGLISSGMKEGEWIGQVIRDCEIIALGVEEDRLSHSEYLLLEEQQRADLFPAQAMLKKLRASKSQAEAENIMAAQEITERAFSEILGLIRPEMTELELGAELQYRMLMQGAEDMSFKPIVVAGERTSLPHGVPTQNKLSGFVTMDFGCVKNGYCSDMTRTVCLGEPTEEMRRVYDVVLEAQEAGIRAARAGIPGRDIDRAARDVIDGAGYGEYFGHSFGHGLGIEVHEAPNAAPSENSIMPVGAVISAEPGIYMEGKFGVRIEDTLLLEANGAVNLTKAPKNLIIL